MPTNKPKIFFLLLTTFLLRLHGQTVQKVPIKALHFFKDNKVLVEHEGEVLITDKNAYLYILENADLKTVKVRSKDEINVSEINLPLHLQIPSGNLAQMLQNIEQFPVSITYKLNNSEADLLEGIVVKFDSSANMIYLKNSGQTKDIYTALPLEKIIQIDIQQNKLKYIQIKTEKPTASLKVHYEYILHNVDWEPANDYEVKNGTFFLKKEVWIRYLGNVSIPEAPCYFYNIPYTSDKNFYKENLYCSHITHISAYSSKRITCGTESVECERIVKAKLLPVFTTENFPLEKDIAYRQKIKTSAELECYLNKKLTPIPSPELASKIKIKAKETMTEKWEGVEVGGKAYDVFFISGEMIIENLSALQMNVLLNKKLLGIVEETSKGTIETEATNSPNKKAEISWELEMKPNDVKVLIYRYKLYVPQMD